MSAKLAIIGADLSICKQKGIQCLLIDIIKLRCALFLIGFDPILYHNWHGLAKQAYLFHI